MKGQPHMSKRYLIGLLVACALGAGACGGGTSPPRIESTPRQAADETDAATDAAALVAVGAPLALLFSSSNAAGSDNELLGECQRSFEQLESFRYSIELSSGYEEPEKIAVLEKERIDEQKASRIDEWAAAGTPEALAEANADSELAAAYQSVQRVFEPERLRWEYLYQAPDRVHETFLPLSPGVFAFLFGSTYREAILIGENSWVQIDGLWQVDEEDESNLTLEDHGEFCELVGTITGAHGAVSSNDSLDGSPTIRYELDTEAVNVLFSDEPEHKSAVMELWLDGETSLPLKFRFEGTADQPSGPDDELIGYDLGVKFELYDLNDPSIQIEPPLVDSQSTAEQ